MDGQALAEGRLRLPRLPDLAVEDAQVVVDAGELCSVVGGTREVGHEPGVAREAGGGWSTGNKRKRGAKPRSPESGFFGFVTGHGVVEPGAGVAPAAA